MRHDGDGNEEKLGKFVIVNQEALDSGLWVGGRGRMEDIVTCREET